MWKRMYASKIFWGVGILLLMGIGVGYFALSSSKAKPVVHDMNNLEQDAKPEIKTVFAAESEEGQSLSLIGTVVSNEFATVYARRNGIIKDLYVDIGDEISENQQIGELLPPGDIGQSSSTIYEKQVRVQEAQDNLEYQEKLAQQKIAAAELSEELQALEGSTSNAEILEKIKVDIDNKTRELSQVVDRQAQQLLQLEADIKQERKQARNIVEQVMETLEHVMLGDDHSTLNINTNDFRKGLGSKNTSTKLTALNGYRNLQIALKATDSIGEEKLLDDAVDVLGYYIDMVAASNPNGDLSQSQLEDFSQMLLVKQKSVLDMFEMLEDVQNMYRTTLESQEQEVIMLENMINNLVAEYEEKSASFGNALEKAEQQSQLITAEQELMIQQAKNRVDIARANLSKEYAVSGNEKIVTPFAGTVSKRMVQVGDMVSMGMPLYELIDVPTSLSKKAKRELQFGLPEEYLTLVKAGDTVRFTVGLNSSNYYTGVIHRVSPQVDEMTKTVTVQAFLDDSIELPHNSRANIVFDQIREPSYQVPASAIQYIDGTTKIAVLKEDQPSLIDVSVVSDDGEFADVQGEITKNSKIIINYHLVK